MLLIFSGKAKFTEERKYNSLESGSCSNDRQDHLYSKWYVIENNNKFDGDIFMRSEEYNTLKIQNLMTISI